MALLHARGEMQVGETQAIIPEITGCALRISTCWTQMNLGLRGAA